MVTPNILKIIQNGSRQRHHKFGWRPTCQARTFPITRTVIVFVFGLAISYSSHADETSLNAQFHQVFNASLLNRTKSISTGTIDQIEDLQEVVTDLNRTNKPIDALATIIANINVLYRNIDNHLIPDLTWYLYSHNAKTSADAVVSYAQQNTDQYSAAKIQLQQAKYFFIIGDWASSLTILNSIDAFSNLEDDDANYSYLVRGIALQQLRRHRESLSAYAKINKNSLYYTTALLNSAQANIRQGWWTDTHILLREAIAIEKSKSNFDFVDRLNLTLGFSLLENGFYRDSRKTFQQVGLDSAYAPRAMIGIAVSAMHQQDFIGALSMLENLLKDGKTGKSVQEAYLLRPFIYEEIDQLKLASANYSHAEAWYQKRSAELASRQSKIDSRYLANLLKNTPSSLLEYNYLDQDDVVLDPLARLNLKLTHILLSSTSEPSLRKKIEALQKEYDKLAIESLTQQIDNQKQVIESYLSQTRFALANLYDK